MSLVSSAQLLTTLAVGASLGYLLSQIDPKLIEEGGKVPFFDVKLDLNPLAKGDDAVFFSPPLDGPPDAPSVMGYVHQIMSDFYNVVKLIKRLDRTEGDFLKEMEENEAVRFNVHRIIDECEHNQEACREYKKPFLKHKNLWAKEIQATLLQFLEEEGTVKPEDDGKPKEGEEASSSDKALPSLPGFDKRITELKDTALEIKEMENSTSEGWLKIDAKPIKTALGKTATQWTDSHTAYLRDYVDSTMSDLQGFISRVQAGLAEEVEEGDSEKLIEAMTYVRDVRLASDRIDGIFEPLKGTIGLLKKFGIVTPDETVETLENIPFSWENTKKQTYNKREVLGDYSLD